MAMDQATLDLAARELPMLMTPGYRPPPSYVTGLSWLPGLPPFNMATVDAMRRDYQVKLAMAMKVVPVMKPLFAITGDPEVVDFVKSELRSIWTSSITDMTEAMWYTRFGCEMVYKKSDGDVWRFSRMMPYHPRDFKILTKDGEITGLRVVSSSSTANIDTDNFAGQPNGSKNNKAVLFAPKSFVYVHDKKFGSFEGMSELEGAYPSWMEKVREGGAIASRSLWSYKCMFDSGMIIHPEGSYTDPATGQQIPYRDFALKIGEAIRNGSVVAVPGVTDGNGTRLWDWIRPEINSGGDALMNLIDHLDGKINKGSGIPDDVIEQVSGTGSYAGRTIPFIAFLEAGTPTVRNISRELCRQALVPLAQINFGESRGKDWEITEAGVNTAQFLGDAKSARLPGDGDGDGIPNEAQQKQQQQMSLARIKTLSDEVGLQGPERHRFTQYSMSQIYAKSSVTFEVAEPRRVLRAKTIQMSTEQPRDDIGRWTAGHSAHGKKLPRNRDKLSHHQAIPLVNAMGFHVDSHQMDADGNRVFSIQNKHGEKKRITHEELIDLAYSKPSGESQIAPKVKSSHVLEAMQKVEPGAHRGALVSTRDLRKQFSDLSKEDFDAKIVRMAQKGKLTLHHHDFASSLSPDQRDELVSYPVPDGHWWGHKGRAYVVGVATRGDDTHQMSQSAPESSGRWITIGGHNGSGDKGGARICIGRNGKILKGPAGLKGENIKSLGDKDATSARQARAAHAKALGKSGRDLTEHEARKLGSKAHIEAHGHAKESARQAGVSTHDVLQNMPEAHKFRLEQHGLRESAKTRAREMAGMNAGVLARIENSHRDHSSVPGFDTAARTVAIEHPELGLDPNSTDTPAAVWELIREGKAELPRLHDRETAQQAAEWVGQAKKHHKVTTDHDTADDTSFDFGFGADHEGPDQETPTWESDSGTHNIDLPHNPSKLSIQTAQQALNQMGFEIGLSHHDLQAKKTVYDVKNRAGQIRKLNTDEIKKLVYSAYKDEIGPGQGEFHDFSQASDAVKNEPRDSDGKWTTGGGSSVKSGESKPNGDQPQAELKTVGNGYPSVTYQGKPILEHFTPEQAESIESEFSDVDEVVASLALGGNYSESDLDSLPEDVKTSLIAMGTALRQKLEHVPTGEEFKESAPGTYFRLHRGPITPDQLHDNHQSRLWVDDGNEASTRKGLSTTASIDDLLDYFTGQQGNSLGRGAFFQDAHIVELKGKPSDDEAYEGHVGETLIHPTEIVKQAALDKTDFMSRLVKRTREKRPGEDGIITYDAANDKVVRIRMDGGKIAYSDY